MGTLTAYRAIDLVSPSIWYGNVLSYDSSHIRLSDGVRTGIYYGFFTYSAYGLSGGTVTGYDLYTSGVLTMTARGGNVDALTYNGYLDAGDAVGAAVYALRSNDVINGSSFADRIRGYG